MKSCDTAPTAANAIEARAAIRAAAFGAIVRGRRKALKLRQDQLALATGVGRRFVIELEAGKPSCHLGRSLLVADALGLTVADLLGAGAAAVPALADDSELPEPLAEVNDMESNDMESNDLESNDREAAGGRSAGLF